MLASSIALTDLAYVLETTIAVITPIKSGQTNASGRIDMMYRTQQTQTPAEGLVCLHSQAEIRCYSRHITDIWRLMSLTSSKDDV